MSHNLALIPHLQPLSSGHETMPRALARDTLSLPSTSMRLGYWRARRAETVTKVYAGCITAAGATPTLIRFGLYSVDSSNNLTLVASTPNDTALMGSAAAVVTKSLSASYALTPGQRYATAVLVVTAASVPQLAGVNLASPVALWGSQFPADRVNGQVSGQSDLPASVSSGSVVDLVNWPLLIVSP